MVMYLASGIEFVPLIKERFFEMVVFLIIVSILVKLLKLAKASFIVFLVIGTAALIFSAAIPFIPESPPEKFKITESDMEYITDMQEKGYFDYEFAEKLFWGE